MSLNCLCDCALFFAFNKVEMFFGNFWYFSCSKFLSLSGSELQILNETLCNMSDWGCDLRVRSPTMFEDTPQLNYLTIHVHPLAQFVLSPFIMYTDNFIISVALIILQIVLRFPFLLLRIWWSFKRYHTFL